MNRGELIARAYREMGAQTVEGILTDGTTTSITDSTISGKYSINKFRNWVMFIVNTTDTLAPKDQYKVCSGSARTGVVTLKSALTVAPAANDWYMLCKQVVPIHTMERLTTEALDELGASFHRLDTSLSTANSTLEYTLPVATKGQPFVELYLLDSDNNQYSAPNYTRVPAEAGSTETLRFYTQPKNSCTIVIRYRVEHGTLVAYDDEVDESIIDALAISQLVAKGLKNIAYPRRRGRDVENMREAEARAAQLAAVHKPKEPPKQERFINAARYN